MAHVCEMAVGLFVFHRQNPDQNKLIFIMLSASLKLMKDQERDETMVRYEKTDRRVAAWTDMFVHCQVNFTPLLKKRPVNEKHLKQIKWTTISNDLL